MKKLTPRQRGILLLLLDGDQTPNRLAMNLGFKHGGRRRGNGAAGRGGWSGNMAPANRVIFSLISLRNQGLTVFYRDDYGSYPERLTVEGTRRATALQDDGATVEAIREELGN